MRVVSVVRVVPEVAAALAAGRPVVALESSVLAQGLPAPHNRDAAARLLDAVRAAGATPAITAVMRGIPTAGVHDDELERLLAQRSIAKVSMRDLPVVMARGGDGATTVAAALTIARLAGIAVFATGGIGGVHRTMGESGVSFDESADLLALACSPLVVVCAGAKAILDLPATLERLETLGVPVLGYRTSELPGFYTVGTGLPLAARVETPEEIAAVQGAQRRLGSAAALLVVQPPPAASALERTEVEGAVREALSRASREAVGGAALTPYLLAAVERITGGKSLGANLALLASNATLAAAVAVALAEARIQ